MENALRVTPAGRPVVLALSSVLEVRDGGPGLAPEDYAVAFDRGVLHARYQESRPVGTGVGLMGWPGSRNPFAGPACGQWWHSAD